MKPLTSIAIDPAVMGGRACIRGTRVTVGLVAGMFAAGHSPEEVLGFYPYLSPEDISGALFYASLRSSEFEVPL